MSHWAEAYIGQPWVAGEHDCWAFARRVWREHFGLDVPAVDVDACNRMACSRAFAGHGEYSQWVEVAQPRDGDAALIGQSSRPSHVGVFVAGGVLHCMEKAGVVYQTPQAMAATGWRVLAWYRHISRCG